MVTGPLEWGLTVEGGYDTGGVAAFSKKENLGKEEFVHDQVTLMY